MQGHLIFPHPTRYRLFQRGSTRHVTPRHDDVSDTESTDIAEVLPVGYQVTSLLGALLWLSVGQDSHFPIQPVLHVIHIPDSSTPLRQRGVDMCVVSWDIHLYHTCHKVVSLL